MKKARIIQRTLSTFLAAAMLATLASCNAKLPGSKNSAEMTNQPRQIVNYYTSELLNKPADLGYIRNVFASGEKLYLYGQKSSDSAELISGLYNMAENKVEDVTIEGIDPDMISTLSVVGDRIVVLYSEPDTYKPKMALLDAATYKKVAEKDMQNDGYIESVTSDASGDIVAVQAVWGMNGGQYFIKTFDQKTLEEKSSINISEGCKLTENSYLSGAVFNEDGSFYTLIIDYDMENKEETKCRLIKFAADGSLAYENADLLDLQGGGMLLKMKNGSICVMSSVDEENFFFNEIDGETGAVKERYEMKLGRQFYGICLNCGPDADFCYTTEDTLYKVDIASGKPEKIATFGSDLPESYKNVYQMVYSGGKILFFGRSYGDSYDCLFEIDKTGAVKNSIPLSTGDDESNLYTLKPDSEGNMYGLICTYKESEDEEGNFNYKEIYSMAKFNESGFTGEKFDLETGEDGESKNRYFHDFSFTSSGDIAVLVNEYDDMAGEGSSYVAVYDTSGKFKSKIEDDSIDYINSYVATSAGDYIIFYGKKGKTSYAAVEDGKLGEINGDDLPADMNEIMESDGNYDFCFTTSEGIYGFTKADKKVTEIVNWIDSDIIYNVNNSAIIDDETILCQAYDYETGEPQVYILHRADADTLEKIRNKKIMTIAGINVGNDSEFREKIVDFNRNSDEYRIQLNDYGKYSKYEDDTYTSGAFKLNSDMSAGNVPDIIIGNSEVSMDSFAAKNILTDLGPYFEKDSDIKKEDYFESVLDLCTYKGKLCQIFSNFELDLLAGPASKLGKENHWTFDEFLALKKNGRIFYKDMTRGELENILITNNLAEFVDLEEKTCDFNNDRFTAMIDLIVEEGKTGEEDEDEDMYKDNFGVEYAGRFKNGDCQVTRLLTYGFHELLELQQGAVGEELALKGLPSENGSGVVLAPSTSLAICEKSKYKDAAWDFIKLFLSADYQDGMNENYINSLPVRKDSFDKLVNRAKSKEEMDYYTITTAEGLSTEMKPLDDATAKKIKETVEAADRIAVNDTRINEIIDEALEAVYNGSKTSADAASDIQNKVSTYLNEIK